MTSRTPAVRTIRLQGPAGALQGIQESPAARAPAGVALLCHPHPRHGGAMDNKVVYTLARSFLNLGCVAIRFNFRGVGDSEGSYAEGVGETEDALAVAAWVRRQWPELRLYLGGFSFGALVALRVTPQLPADGLVTVAPPVAGIAGGIDQPRCPWLVVQGDKDEVVDADEVVAWLNSLEPGPDLRIMSGAEHFFHGRLSELRNHVVEFFQPEISSGLQLEPSER